MKISKEQFEEAMKNEQLAISMIGMSNIGKTYWAKQLARIGFKHIICDDLIEAKLGPELKELGYKGIEDVSKWMGQPYDARFELNQEKYLRHEIEVMQEILRDLSNERKNNIIIDTTGSVIHTSDIICLTLKEQTLVLYIEADEQIKKQMFAQYLLKPKPVVWGEIYQPYEGETGGETLKRCYPDLLKYRSSRYAHYADVTIPRGQIGYDMSIEQFLELIKKSL
jgi:shikimate kinase